MQHDRLVPKAVPRSSQDEPVEAQAPAKTADLPVVSFHLETDVKPSSKEDSTMAVSTSAVTGLSFINPHAKRPKHVHSYVELLTRQHISTPQSNSSKTVPQNKKTLASNVIKPVMSNVCTMSTAKTRAKVIPCAIMESSTATCSIETADTFTAKLNPPSTNHTLNQTDVQEKIQVPQHPANSLLTIDPSVLPDMFGIKVDPNMTQLIEIDIPAAQNYENCPSEVKTDIMPNDLFMTPPKTLRNALNLPRKRKLPLNNQSEIHLLPVRDISTNEPKQSSVHIVSNEPFDEKYEHIANLINRSISLPTVNPSNTLESNAATENQINIINKQLLEMFEKKKAKIAAAPKLKSPEKKSLFSQNRPLNEVNKESMITVENVVTTNMVQPPSKSETQVTKDIPVNECLKMIHENSKEIAELKRMLLAQKTEKSAPPKSRSMNPSKKMSKSYLFTHLIPYLSPELAQMVHKEMFPLLSRK